MSDYDEKLTLLESILKRGLEKLALEAQNNGFLEAPYGRKPYPTPLISEADFVRNGGVNSDDAEPEFNFEYGFDPLRFLSDYIQWSHPHSVESRRMEKVSACEYLRRRTDHARLQLETAESLKSIAAIQSSGILWGPFLAPIDSSSMLCICQPIRFGTVVFEVSTSADFSSNCVTLIEETTVHTIEDDESPAYDAKLENILPVKVHIDKLTPGQKYFLRASLVSGVKLDTATTDLAAEPLSSTSRINDDEDEEELQSDRAAKDSAKLDVVQQLLSRYEELYFAGAASGNYQRCEFYAMPLEEVPETSDAPQHDDAEDEKPPALSSVDRNSRSSITSHVEQDSTTGTTGVTYPTVEMCCVGQLPGVGSTLSTIAKKMLAKCEESKESRDPHIISVTCLLGDPFVADKRPQPPSFSDDQALVAAYRSQLLSMYTLSDLFSTDAVATAPFKRTPLLLGWKDSFPYSDKLLQVEELAHKKFRHELSKYQKKYASDSTKKPAQNQIMPPPPVHRPPPIVPALQCLLETFPLDFYNGDDAEPVAALPSDATVTSFTVASTAADVSVSRKPASFVVASAERACRMLYRTLMLGPDVQLFVLDTRANYLGKEQTRWLVAQLEKSQALWKVVLSGQTLAAVAIESLLSSVVAEDPQSSAPLTESEPTAESTVSADGQELGLSKLKSVASNSVRGVQFTESQDEDTKKKAKSRDRAADATAELLHRSQEKGASQSVPALVDDVDELTGRPKHGLLCVLATLLHHNYDRVGSLTRAADLSSADGAASKFPSIKSEHQHLPVVKVSSGVLVVSSGLCPVIQEQLNSVVDRVGSPTATRKDAAADVGLDQHESKSELAAEPSITYVTTTSSVLHPFFVAGYCNLAAPNSTADATYQKDLECLRNIDLQQHQSNATFKEAFSTYYCAEFCLGNPDFSRTSKMSSPRSTDQLQKGKQYTFGFSAGVEVETICGYEGNDSLRRSVSRDITAQGAELNSDGAPGSAAASLKLTLLQNGSMRATVSTLLHEDSRAQASEVIYDCIVQTPLPVFGAEVEQDNDENDSFNDL